MPKGGGWAELEIKVCRMIPKTPAALASIFLFIAHEESNFFRSRSLWQVHLQYDRDTKASPVAVTFRSLSQ